MNREKILNATSIRVNYGRYMYLGLRTTLATAFLITTAISANCASAADDLLDNSFVKKPISRARQQSHISSAVVLSDKIVLEEDEELAKFENSIIPTQLTTAISANRASAADDLLDNSFVKKPISRARQQSHIRSAVALSSNIMFEEDEELAKFENSIAPTPTKLIAQTDSSGFVGDTLGEINKLRQELLIDPITIRGRFRAAPASSAGTPTGYGASWRQGYVGAGVYFPFDEGRVDGSGSLGFGVGDAVKSVGVEFGLNITSFGGTNFDFGDSGSLGFKIHKYFTNGTAVAVGWSNPIKWGDVNDAKDTIYGVVTKPFYLQPNNPNNRMPLTLSLGLGSGIFRSVGAIESRNNSVNVFGSIGLRFAPQASLVSSWTGNSLNIGGSFTPLRKTPIVINAIFTDVTNNLDRGTGLSVSAGYVFQF